MEKTSESAQGWAERIGRVCADRVLAVVGFGRVYVGRVGLE